jgi:hypothetical protein
MVLASLQILCCFGCSKCFPALSSPDKIPGVPEHDLLSFRREIVQVYMKTLSPQVGTAVVFLPSHLSIARRVLPEVRSDAIGHWIIQATQRRCVAPGCKGTSVFAYEKCNVRLHLCISLQPST